MSVAMAWRAIPGFLFKDYWYPFAATNVVRPVEAPTEDCKTLCARTTHCCRWAVRDVRSWQDAKDADATPSHLAWVMAGENLNNIVGEDPTWTFGAGNTIVVTAVVANMILTPTAGNFAPAAAQNINWAVIPGQDLGATSFYALFVLTQANFIMFDKNGQPQVTFTKTPADGIVTLTADPTLLDANIVSFVRSYSCGLFKKTASETRLAVEAEKFGLLEKCGGENKEEKCEGSNCNPKAAFEAQMERVKNGKWSGDTSVGSHGISFASIVCAVFASVTLVFVVLVVAKKNCHPEVAPADE